MNIIQLLLSGGSTQSLGLRAYRGYDGLWIQEAGVSTDHGTEGMQDTETSFKPIDRPCIC